jgi:pimeloyl-ACP methyl ester carboxylesterase
MKKILVISFFIFSIFFLGCKPDNNLGKFVKAPSPVKAPEGLEESGKFSFGYMKVPEMYKNPDGKTIELALAVFKSQSDSATNEPLVLVTGGPGMSDIDAFVPDLFGDLGNLFLNNRDIVVIELRGLKYSNPNLLSPEIDNLQMYLLDKNLSSKETIEIYMDTLKSVYIRFEREGINLSAYNDYEIANDIVYVMDKLGYTKFSIFGSSFGTLVTQHVLLNHSDHVVSAVMNAVVDINKAANNMHTNSIKTLDTIFAITKSDEKLNEAYPDLKNRFLALVKRLNEKPDTLQIKYAKDNKIYKFVLNGNKLSVWVFGRMYWDAQLPLTLHEILSGDYGQIINNPGMLFPLTDFSNGLSLSILLSEYSNFEDKDIPVNNEYADFVKGSGTMIFSPYFLNRAKEVWKVNDLQDKNISIISDVPTLMFMGELDPVSSPDYAVKLSNNLKNSYLYIFPGVAHSPIDFGKCAILMMKEFIDDPTKAPDDACIQEFQSGFNLPE